VFRVVVATELNSVGLLWAATATLAGQLVGVVDGDWPAALSMLAVLVFCSIWLSFLVAGQGFYYWYGDRCQHTRFLAAIWGIATLLLLAV
jgi:hypothetical protein